MNMNGIVKYSWLLLLAAGMMACSDVIEDPLDDQRVHLLAPGDHVRTGIYAQTFWWDEMGAAIDYQLQVVSPSFDSIAVLVLDTVVKKNKFTYLLKPGVYEWRLRARNGSSMTPFTTYHLTITPSSITNQSVILSGPATGIETNVQQAQLQWQELFGATRYRVQIDTMGFNDEKDLVYNHTTTSLSLAYYFLTENHYQWRVRAENDTALSQWSGINTIRYDVSPPDAPVLIAPIRNSNLPKPVALSWAAVPEAISYKLYVYKSDSVSPYNPSFPLMLSSTGYSFNLGSSSEHVYWQVSATDKAGNESIKSELRNFRIN